MTKMTPKDKLRALLAKAEELEAKATKGPWSVEDRPHRISEQCYVAITTNSEYVGHDLFDTLNRGYKVSLIEQQVDEDSGGKWYDRRGYSDLYYVALSRNSFLPVLRLLVERLDEYGECKSEGIINIYEKDPNYPRDYNIEKPWPTKPCPSCTPRYAALCAELEKLGVISE